MCFTNVPTRTEKRMSRNTPFSFYTFFPILCTRITVLMTSEGCEAKKPANEFTGFNN